MEINYRTSDGELKDYLPYLNKFLKIEMNQPLTGHQEIAEAILDLIIGSRNIRQGKAPMIEVQSNIIKLVKACMDINKPIPILVGSGPKKTSDDASIDIAELSVLAILNCLNNEVKKYFKPGLDIQIRLDDMTGLWLESISAEASMIRYMEDFKKLLNILGYDGINLFRESDYIDKARFQDTAHKYTQEFQRYLLETDQMDEKDYQNAKSYQDLVDMGWYGIIPKEMRDYLYSKYTKLYPEFDKSEQIEMVARYLGATLARIHTNCNGMDPTMYKSKIKPMEIAFARPTPGIPDSIQQARVYYRSVTMKNTKKNMPFWRAKGVLKVDRNGKVRYSLVGWSQEESQDIIPGWYLLSNDNEMVKVNAGVIIED